MLSQDISFYKSLPIHFLKILNRIVLHKRLGSQVISFLHLSGYSNDKEINNTFKTQEIIHEAAHKKF
jgi:hypothetical protein